MTSYVDTIKRGERLTGGSSGSLNRATNAFNRLVARTDIRAIDTSRTFAPVGSRPFLARIYAWEAVAGNANRWRYAWEEVVIDSEDHDQLSPTGRKGTIAKDYAINLVELNNTDADGPQGNSVDTSGQLFTDNATLEVMPVGGGENGTPGVEPVVLMVGVNAAGGKQVYVFQYENAIDGECA